ncbi:MAG: hypothetical protein H7Y22_00700 [Gemmatimonadaceae bacterium]|nr:hypothetical protein [Gloeobacterales cyanobacterium ES-bin-141]
MNLQTLRVWSGRLLLAAILVPGLAAVVDAATVTGLRVVETEGKRQLVVDLSGSGPRAQVVTTLRDNAWVAELKDTQLAIGSNPNGNYRQDRPAQAIELLEATQTTAQTVRIRMVGQATPPQVSLIDSTALQIVFDMEPSSATPLKASGSSRLELPDSNRNGEAPRRLSARAVAPPTGDIAIGEITVGKPVELNSTDRITLVLKDAPVREVLQILARRAGYNILFGGDIGAQRISMDIQGEALDDTFNFVLRLNDLKGRLVGKTILVGKEIAQDLLQTQIRTFRLNQADVNQVAGVLRGLGAQVTGGSSIGGSTGGAGAAGGLSGATGAGASGGSSIGAGPLKGELFVTLDARTNALTAIGTPRALQIAQAQIAQLDIRSRQVMIDVKLIDVNLNDVTDLGFKLGGAAGNFSLGNITNNNFGSSTPAGGTFGQVGPTSLAQIAGTTATGAGLIFSTLTGLSNAIALRLDTAIQQGSAKILASPKIVVQSGENFSKAYKAEVKIVDNVIIGTKISVDPATGLTSTTPNLGEAGVTLNIEVFNIDDNGYINLALKPNVSSVYATQVTPQGDVISLLTVRSLDISRLRLRDGQTFVIGGVIRDQDRNLVTKIPFLGDLPILGALFRSQSNQKERREVALIVTPHILRDPVEEVGPGPNGQTGPLSNLPNP